MAVDRVDRDVELARDLGSGQICRQIPQHAQLAWAQLLRWRHALSLGARCARRGGASQHVGDVGEESAVSRFMTWERIEQLPAPGLCKREDEVVWLGGRERRLGRVAGGVSIAQGQVRDASEQMRLNKPER